MIKSKTTHRLPLWINLWLFISISLVSYDVLFIFLRPQTLPGGDLANIWFVYDRYIKIDLSYKDINNYFVFSQAIMSCVEIFIALVGLYIFQTQKNLTGYLMIFCSFSLTTAKTILILLIALVSRGAELNFSTPSQVIFIFIIPNLLWVIMPCTAAIKILLITTKKYNPNHIST